MTLAILALTATTLVIPSVPDFSGTWTHDSGRSTSTGGGTGQKEHAGGGRGGGLGLGQVPDRLTIRQEAASLEVEEHRGAATSRIVYALDGRKGTNVVAAGQSAGGSASYASVWEGQRLVTNITMPASPEGKGTATYQEVRYLASDGALVVETTMAGRANARRVVYTRSK
jgi:hypothetical protein